MQRSGPSLRSVCITPVSPTQALAVHTYTVDGANHWQGIGLEVWGGVAGGGRSSLFCLRGCKAASQVAAPAPCTDSNLPARFLSHNCGHCLVSAFSVSLTTVSVASIFGKGANYSRHTVLAAIGTPSQSLIFIPRSPVALLAPEVRARQPLSEKAQNKDG